MIRTARASWHGTGRDGNGQISTQSLTLDNAVLTYKTRFGDDKGTNPEELIAAAHAGCFTMAVAFALQSAGYTPQTLSTDAALTIEAESGGYRISKSALTLHATIPGIANADFQEIAAAAEKNCPVSKVLNAEITLDAQLV
jgi:lipoyl-dependent peroxiredoxin